MFMGYASNHKGDCYRTRNPKTKKVSETHDVLFLNRMFFKVPKIQVKKIQVTNDADIDSVQQDKRGGCYNGRFCCRQQQCIFGRIRDSSVPDTPMVNSNPGQSKYGRAYRRTMYYDPATGRTIGGEATALANYYQCLKDIDGKMKFANVRAGIGREFENTMEL